MGTETPARLTIAERFVLARIYVWGVHLWRPESGRVKAFALLDNPVRSPLNIRIVERLIAYGLLEEGYGALVLTDTGTAAAGERPDIIARIRLAEAA